MFMVPKNELKNFYISVSLYNFATSLVQLFVPLFLFGKGFSVSSILFFYVLVQAGRLAALPISAHFSSLYGAKRIISVAFIVQIIAFYFLGRIEDMSVYFYISALIYGSVWSFLWLPYLVHQSKISPDKDRGKINGKINIYSTVASAFGPFLGGVAISSFGFSSSFAIAILLTIPAIYILLLTPEVSKIRKINYSLINIRKVYPDLIANGFYNLQNFLNGVFWILFIFLIVPEYKIIGSMQTVALLVSIISFYFIGVWTDKFNRTKMLALGSILNSVAGLLRVLAGSVSGVFLINIISTSTGTLEATPWNVKLQEHMDQDARTEYMAIFEIGGTIITLIGLLVVSFLFNSMPVKESLTFGLIIASISGLFVNFMRK